MEREMNNLDQKLKWVATVILIVGSFVNALGIYPLGPILLILGGFFWLVVSIMWREASLIVTNGVMLVAGISGLILGVL
jgi:hypothetical protein